MISRPELEDRVGGRVQLEEYQGHSLELEDWKLISVLDDILMVQYIDVNEEGTEIKRGSIWVPINTVNFVWRIGKVILAGPGCKTTKEGDYIVFPNDKGIKAAKMNDIKNVVFLSEGRIFGICEPKFVEKSE
jgi:co-chaperonin GroES (HSP10)